MGGPKDERKDKEAAQDWLFFLCDKSTQVQYPERRALSDAACAEWWGRAALRVVAESAEAVVAPLSQGGEQAAPQECHGTILSAGVRRHRAPNPRHRSR